MHNATTPLLKHRVVVLGAGYAGMSAAMRLAKPVDPDTVTVDLVNASDRFVQRGVIERFMAATVSGDVAEVYWIANPDKLVHIAP